VHEEADAVGDTDLAQLRGHRNEVIIVHPDQVVRPDQWRQQPGEEAVDPEIARHVLAGELREVEPVMAQRPQRPVGEAGVVLVDIPLAEVGDRIGDIAEVADLEPLGLALAAGPAGPAEPHAAAGLQRGFEGNGQAPGTRRLAFGRRNRDPVRHHHQSRQVVLSDTKRRRARSGRIPLSPSGRQRTLAGRWADAVSRANG